MPKEKPIKRQAVVIIHGIGEQRPMATLRSFSSAISKVEQAPSGGLTWSKPDSISEGFEHHRFTIAQSRSRPVTDVYEPYWAHLFEQSNPSTFLSWASRLLFRPIPKLPLRYQIASLVLWGLIIVLAVVGFWAWNNYIEDTWLALITAMPAIGFLYAVIGFAANKFFLGTISDAARYLDANPRNVEARNKVRELGVGFLDRLHKSDRKYDRIIVCGHSLGSVIGYDILQRLWYEMHEDHAPVLRPNQEVQKSMARIAAARDGTGTRRLQRDLWLEQIEMGNKWRVTDFVTMGSPLAHADALMANSEEEFRAAFDAGELSACPPFIDPTTKRIGYPRSYDAPGGKRRTLFVLRHTAAFAVTRWTNVYFKTWAGVVGDPIGGPVGKLFGPGIQDIEVGATGFDKFFSQLAYWQGDAPAEEAVGQKPETALEALRVGLDIDRKVITPTGDD